MKTRRFGRRRGKDNGRRRRNRYNPNAPAWHEVHGRLPYGPLFGLERVFGGKR